MQRWFCGQSERHAERVAIASLKAKGFETFLPVMEERETTRPLFPGYFFARFDREQPGWKVLVAAHGVKRSAPLLGMRGELPQPLPIGCVEELQDRMAAGEFIKDHPQALQVQYAPGASVRVTDGPWWSYRGLVEHSDRERVFVLLSVFNRPTRVPIRREWVESAA